MQIVPYTVDEGIEYSVNQDGCLDRAMAEFPSVFSVDEPLSRAMVLSCKAFPGE